MQAIHYTLGSWYKDYEVSRRGGFFYVGLCLGTLTSSLLQAAASTHLDGVNNLAGWRWMFIINGIVTLPLGLLCFFVWPGTPDYCRSIFFTQADAELAKRRMADSGHGKPKKNLSFAVFKKVFTTPRFYLMVVWNIFFWNGGLNYSTGGYLLWLKSLERYSVGKLNNLGAISPALGILWVLIICFSADMFKSRAGALIGSHMFNCLGLIILIIWNTPEATKWFAFQLTYFGVAMSSVLYGWTNDIVKGDDQERIIYLILMNAIGQGTTAFTIILTFPTKQGPQFRRGYTFVFVCSVLLMVFTVLVNQMHKKQIAQEEKRLQDEDDSLNSQDHQESSSSLNLQVEENDKSVNNV